MARNEITYYKISDFMSHTEECAEQYADDVSRALLLARCRELALFAPEVFNVIGRLGGEVVWADGAELPA